MSRLFLSIIVTAVAATDAAVQTRQSASAKSIDSLHADIERYQTALERSPRFGTAFDRVYGYYAIRGRLDEFAAMWHDRTERNPADGVAWMISGMIALRDGRAADAVTAFELAERTRPDDALASELLAQSLLNQGNIADAAAALERALERKPSRARLINILEMLGRIALRGGNRDTSRAVWDRIDALFPDVLPVHEHVAELLANELDFTSAQQRFERLAKRTRDPDARTRLELRAVEMQAQSGQADAAITAAESLLDRLQPDAWLHGETRRIIEGIVRQTTGATGLIDYYQQWMESHPDDIDAMQRLARAHVANAQDASARECYERAVARSPENEGLRRSLIELLIRTNDVTAAETHFVALDTLQPGDFDVLSEWGRLVLRDTSRPRTDRLATAANIWRRLVPANDDVDSSRLARVAELFRDAALHDESMELLRRAIEQSPQNPRLREQLGDELHAIGRIDDAIAAWRGMAEGEKHTVANLMRVADRLTVYGHREPAVAAMTAACELEPTFDRLLQLAEACQRAGRFNDAVPRLDQAEQYLSTPAEREQLHDARIALFRTSTDIGPSIDTLTTRIASASASASASTITTDRLADRLPLARRLAAIGKFDVAASVLEPGLASAPNNLAAWFLAAHLWAGVGDMSGVVEANRQLARIDADHAAFYLKRIIGVATQTGDLGQAVATARELVVLSPDDGANRRLLADLLTRSGQDDDAVAVLIDALIAIPHDTKSLRQLAEIQAGRQRMSEAIETYWQVFELESARDVKHDVVIRMAELYAMRDQFDHLLQRLEDHGRARNQRKEMAVFAATACRSVGDLATARRSLRPLVANVDADEPDGSRMSLLMELSRCAEIDGDFDEAIELQQRIISMEPLRDHTVRLARLLAAGGRTGAAETVWLNWIESRDDPRIVLQAIDGLLNHGRNETALRLAARRLLDDPHDWEALFREIIALWRTNDKPAAIDRCRAIIAIDASDDMLSRDAAVLEQRRLALSGLTSADDTVGSLLSEWQTFPRVLARSAHAQDLQRAFELRVNVFNGSQYDWYPHDFGAARYAALALIHEFETAQAAVESSIQVVSGESQFDRRAAWDAWSLNSYRFATTLDPKHWQALFAASRELARNDASPDAAIVCLAAVANRPGQTITRSAGALEPEFAREAVRPDALSDSVSDSGPDAGIARLSPDDLNVLQASYQRIAARRPAWLLSGFSALHVTMTEFRRAGQADRATQLYEQAVRDTTSIVGLRSVIDVAADEGDIEAAMEIAAHIEDVSVAGSRTPADPAFNPWEIVYRRSIRRLSKAHDVAQLRSILDRHLRLVSRHPHAAQTALPSVGSRAGEPIGGLSNQRHLSIRLETDQRPLPVFERIDFPSPNRYLSERTIGMLYNVFAVHRRDGRIDDLLQHLRAAAENVQSSGPTRATFFMSLASIQWWNEQPAAAIESVRTAAELAPHDFELSLLLARLCVRNGEPDVALSIIDELDPIDAAALAERETLALNLCVLSGNIDRAKLAAGRLSALRHTPKSLTGFAKSLHQLQLTAAADAMLDRAARITGNDAETLAGLMRQYAMFDRADAAARIARQILRLTERETRSDQRIAAPVDSPRRSAIQTLVTVGQFDDVLREQQARIELVPDSVSLRQTLVHDYAAAGLFADVLRELRQLVVIAPENMSARMQLAAALLPAGEIQEACDHYLVAIKEQPELLGRNYWDIQSTFMLAKRQSDLTDLLLAIDVQRIGEYYYIDGLIHALLNDSATRVRGMDLFEHAWAAFPAARVNLLIRLRQLAAKLDDAAGLTDLADRLDAQQQQQQSGSQ